MSGSELEREHILGHALTVTVHAVSASARTKCRCVGGKAGSTKTMFTQSSSVETYVRKSMPGA
jgi:hypothetical protein